MKIEITQFPDGFRLKHYSSGIFSKKKRTRSDGGLSGVRITQSRTEIRKNTAQNNTRKQQKALKLSENF